MTTEEIAIDPVCDMKVKVATAKNTTLHAGHTYYFCGPKCLVKFTGVPGKSLKPGPAEAVPPSPPAPGTIFTCPMHPEVRQVGPGSCPKCGMALDPVTFTAATAQEVNPEYVAMLHRFWLSFPLAMALMVLMYLGAHLRWLGLALATPVV